MLDSENKLPKFFSVIWLVLRPEKKFFLIVLIYGLVISLFTLVIPVSVQALVTTITNTLLLRPVVVLSTILFCLLLFAIILNATQIYIMEMMERHLYARIAKEISLRLLYVDENAIDDINRVNLSNRYFEIMNLQKTLPSILVRSFALILQTSVGLVLVSFYHQTLFALNLVIFAVLFLIWRIWKNRAFAASVKVSSAKYETARLISEIARSNSIFRSSRNINYAVAQINNATAYYVKLRKLYFRSYFSQHIGFLLLYAIGSTALLGVGGFLVIKEQLTIGQLVAAELIMSAIFYGFTKFSYQLSDIYDLFTSCVKISEFYQLPMHQISGKLNLRGLPACSLELQNVTTQYCGREINFNLKFNAGEKAMLSTENAQIESALMQLLCKKQEDYSGKIYLSDVNLLDLDVQDLQDSAIILDNHRIIECSIKQWLLLANPNATYDELQNSLKMVELLEAVKNLPDGIDTIINPYGEQLKFDEIMRLKLAAAILAKPALIIINPMFDCLNYSMRARIMARILTLDTTFICFTNARAIAGFDSYIRIADDSHMLFNNPTDYVTSLNDGEAYA